MTDHSEIITRMTGLLYPFILLFGFYIILNGHASPGGGFQGGAVLPRFLSLDIWQNLTGLSGSKH